MTPPPREAAKFRKRHHCQKENAKCDAIFLRNYFFHDGNALLNISTKTGTQFCLNTQLIEVGRKWARPLCTNSRFLICSGKQYQHLHCDQQRSS